MHMVFISIEDVHIAMTSSLRFAVRQRYPSIVACCSFAAAAAVFLTTKQIMVSVTRNTQREREGEAVKGTVRGQ